MVYVLILILSIQYYSIIILITENIMKKTEKIQAVKNLIDIIEKWPENDCLTLKTILVTSLELNMISEADAKYISTVLVPLHSCPRELFWSNEDMGY